MNTQAQQVEGRSGYLQAVENLLARARHKIDLYSIALDSGLYASPAAIDCWRQWATGSSRSQARVLVHDAKKAVGQPNALVHLGLQLSSRFEFRDTPIRHLPIGDMLIIDGRHLLRRPLPDSRRALLHIDAPLASREALREFEKVWETALPSTELKRQTL